MQRSAAVRARRRGRPRDPAVGSRVHAAALRLMARCGIAQTSMDAIAAEAGVTKMTLYARWGSKNDLCMEVLRAIHPPQEVGQTDDPRADLTRLLTAAIELHDTSLPEGLLARIIGDMPDNEELAGIFRERIVEARRSAVVRALKRAIAADQLASALDVHAVADVLLGPIYYRRLLRGREVHRKLAIALVDTVYRAYGRRVRA